VGQEVKLNLKAVVRVLKFREGEDEPYEVREVEVDVPDR